MENGISKTTFVVDARVPQPHETVTPLGSPAFQQEISDPDTSTDVIRQSNYEATFGLDRSPNFEDVHHRDHSPKYYTEKISSTLSRSIRSKPPSFLQRAFSSYFFCSEQTSINVQPVPRAIQNSSMNVVHDEHLFNNHNTLDVPKHYYSKSETDSTCSTTLPKVFSQPPRSNRRSTNPRDTTVSHSPHSSGYFSPGFLATQQRRAEEAVTDSPLLTPSGGLRAEQHWVPGSPKLPVHRTVYPGEGRPHVRPEELSEALEGIRPKGERKQSMRDQVSVKDFAYINDQADGNPDNENAMDVESMLPMALKTSSTTHDRGLGNTSKAVFPARIDGSHLTEDCKQINTGNARKHQKSWKGHRRSPARDLRLKDGIMTEV